MQKIATHPLSHSAGQTHATQSSNACLESLLEHLLADYVTLPVGRAATSSAARVGSGEISAPVQNAAA